MEQSERIPTFPAAAALLLRGMPSIVIETLLSRLVAVTTERHPRLFDRLGAFAGFRYLIDPTDLPFVLILHPAATEGRLRVLPRDTTEPRDARIGGPLAALLGLVHGSYDGDALFFSRDLVIEGDTEAVLALRNAIDDAEIDLSEEALHGLGPLRALATPPVSRILPLVERLTGVSLSRPNRGTLQHGQ